MIDKATTNDHANKVIDESINPALQMHQEAYPNKACGTLEKVKKEAEGKKTEIGEPNNALQKIKPRDNAAGEKEEGGAIGEKKQESSAEGKKNQDGGAKQSEGLAEHHKNNPQELVIPPIFKNKEK